MATDAHARFTRPSVDDPYDVRYFRRHQNDDPQRSVPGREFLQSCQPSMRARFLSVLVAVAKAPPHKFSGGGYWEAMKGDMAGLYEVRCSGPKRHHYRLFCVLDNDAAGIDRRLLVIITGNDKPFKTTFSDKIYKKVRELRKEYLSRNPRSLA